MQSLVQDVQELELLVQMYNATPTFENSSISGKLYIKMYLPCDPAIPSFNIHQTEIIASVHIKTCTELFIAGIEPNWNNQISFNGLLKRQVITYLYN